MCKMRCCFTKGSTRLLGCLKWNETSFCHMLSLSWRSVPVKKITGICLYSTRSILNRYDLQSHMTTTALFTEKQYFRQPWLWAILLLINAFIIYGLYKQIYFGEPFGDNPVSNAALVAITIGLLLLTVLFAYMRLETTLTSDGVCYRFFPFQFTARTITWDRISKAFVRQYNPILEYGGWGLRFGIFGSGRAVNVSGNKGLQLVYDEGRKLLIGTRKPDELQQALQQLGRLSPNEK